MKATICLYHLALVRPNLSLTAGDVVGRIPEVQAAAAHRHAAVELREVPGGRVVAADGQLACCLLGGHENGHAMQLREASYGAAGQPSWTQQATTRPPASQPAEPGAAPSQLLLRSPPPVLPALHQCPLAAPVCAPPAGHADPARSRSQPALHSAAAAGAAAAGSRRRWRCCHCHCHCHCHCYCHCRCHCRWSLARPGR